jgi:hypothetical protein
VSLTAMETITDLLATVERLPEPRRTEARDRVAAALEGPASAARLALGALALDLLDDAHLDHPADRTHARPRSA